MPNVRTYKAPVRLQCVTQAAHEPNFEAGASRESVATQVALTATVGLPKTTPLGQPSLERSLYLLLRIREMSCEPSAAPPPPSFEIVAVIVASVAACPTQLAANSLGTSKSRALDSKFELHSDSRLNIYRWALKVFPTRSRIHMNAPTTHN